ncbi:ABC transporter ATP-binding protein [Pseudarthrobacter phenanthrenivorans]|uniref:ABC transporter ATP-binding protein n=2 Tax=Pseudarthrobacter phenanthrenivorans TaxID=361575 RepID=A0A3B0FYH5_PSEPS|nr:ABC transporter ATP-binding protein [Pseudarthrobacter phenanthrenivorans]ADX72369.1 amino acid/amide ABC transporter ATP-binding protein 1, HAAT family [Pseudarthrobacter phenanthrenivorans Sphe3]RKO24950.1 ABC transporter ATP-binding protein [Pseudarthrobacter phenanthrenivorans]TPV51564.1 ABC transporter ATP-binding protein [Pseudarthrobacter phenanthrenivorans]
MSMHSEDPTTAGEAGVDYMTDTRPIAAGEAAPGCKKRDPIVVAENVTRSFGGINAVDVEYLEIPRHKITALIGPNGAGKTTLFNLLTGFDTPNTGKWQFEGKSLAGVSPYKVARMGMVRTFQLTKVMGKLTVMENMRLGASNQPGERLSKALFKGMWGGREKQITQEANVLLEKFKLDAKKDDYAASLSGGQRKLLEMARSLMVRPKLVMLDEPMAGVNPALTQSLLDHIKNLKAEGMTVLFVEHDMHMVRHIADWVVVMAEGKVVAEGPPGEVMKNPAVIDAYLGAHHDVDLGDSEGLKELAAELEADEESIVGTENAGIISLDVVSNEAEEARRGGDQARGDGQQGRHGSTDTGSTGKDSQ